MSLFKSVDVVISNIDFDMLRGQKTALISIEEGVLTEGQYNAIQGIVNLIDAIQDYAVDVIGMDENEVFNFTKEDL